jgi:2-dehydro-3-deoxyphosphooctonate aldolase (KDO 8-P synthase)
MITVEPAPSAVVAVGSVRFGNALPLALIAGPCALESRDHALDMAAALNDIAGRLGIGFVYKTSFDKANRTSAAKRPRLGGCHCRFADIRASLACQCLSTYAPDCARAAEVVDVPDPRVPAARPTCWLRGEDRTRRQRQERQFLAPWDMA